MPKEPPFIFSSKIISTMAPTKKTTATKKPAAATRKTATKKPAAATEKAAPKKAAAAAVVKRGPRKVNPENQTKPCTAFKSKTGELVPRVRLQKAPFQCVTAHSKMIRQSGACPSRVRHIKQKDGTIKEMKVEYTPNPLYGVNSGPGIRACVKAGGRAVKKMAKGGVKGFTTAGVCNPHTQVYKTSTRKVPISEYDDDERKLVYTGKTKKIVTGRCVTAKGKDKNCQVGDILAAKTFEKTVGKDGGKKMVTMYKCFDADAKQPKGWTKKKEGTAPYTEFKKTHMRHHKEGEFHVLPYHHLTNSYTQGKEISKTALKKHQKTKAKTAAVAKTAASAKAAEARKKISAAAKEAGVTVKEYKLTLAKKPAAAKSATSKRAAGGAKKAASTAPKMTKPTAPKKTKPTAAEAKKAAAAAKETASTTSKETAASKKTAAKSAAPKRAARGSKKAASTAAKKPTAPRRSPRTAKPTPQ